MLVEVTSATTQTVCRKVLDTLLYELLLLGIGRQVDEAAPPAIQLKKQFYALNVQQVKIVDVEGNMKAVYPSRNDLIYEDQSINVQRE